MFKKVSNRSNMFPVALIRIKVNSQKYLYIYRYWKKKNEIIENQFASVYTVVFLSDNMFYGLRNIHVYFY